MYLCILVQQLSILPLQLDLELLQLTVYLVVAGLQVGIVALLDLVLMLVVQGDGWVAGISICTSRICRECLNHGI